MSVNFWFYRLQYFGWLYPDFIHVSTIPNQIDRKNKLLILREKDETKGMFSKEAGNAATIRKGGRYELGTYINRRG